MTADGSKPGTWALLATLGAAAALLLSGLGSSGLWEPWEMDRADLARTLIEDPSVVVALSTDEAAAAAVDEAVVAAGAVARTMEPPRPGARGAATKKTIQDAIELARTEVVAAVVVDARLLVEAGDPDWTAAATRVRELSAYVPDGRVVVVAPGGQDLDDAGVRAGLARGWATAALREVLTDLKVRDLANDALDDDADAPPDGALDQAHGRVTVAALSDPGALRAAVEEGISAGRGVVRFKNRGRTHAVAPLEAWSMALSYRIFGVHETATRLPGVLFALAALLVLLLTVRRFWGVRVAVLAGLVLVTTPLFFAQARSAVGDNGMVLALTLVACALLRWPDPGDRATPAAVRAGRRATWAMLGAGLFIGFLAEGLFALLTFAVLTTVLAAVTRARTREGWLLAGASVVALVVAAAWVWSSPAVGFAGMFRLTQPLFSEGPNAYLRTFDYVIHLVGFGSFPWSPFVLIALGALVWAAVTHRDRRYITIVLWFGVPVVLVMATLKSHNHFLWAATPAAAVAVALLLDQIARRGVRSAFVAFIVALTFLILFTELADSPAPLAGFLTFDPPFTKQGDLRFPETLSVVGGPLNPRALLALDLRPLQHVALLAAITLMTLYFGRVWSFLVRAVIFLRRPAPFSIAVGALATLTVVSWLARVLGKFSVGMKLQGARELAAPQREFVSRFLVSTDPLVLVAWATLITLALILGVRLLYPRMRDWLRQPVIAFALLPLAPVLLPLFAVLFAAHHLARLAARVPLRPADRLAAAPAALWIVAAIAMAGSVIAYDGYWAEMLGDPGVVLWLAAGVGAAIGIRVLGAPTRTALVTAAGVVAICLAAQLSRDADHRPWYVAALVALGWIAYARLVVPAIADELSTRFALVGGILAAMALLALTLPLLDRWSIVNVIVYPGSSEDLTTYLALRSRVTWVLGYAGIAALIANRFAGPLVDGLVEVTRSGLERGVTAVAVLVAAAGIFAVASVAGFYDDLAEHVSQKHVVDTYRTAAGIPDRAIGDRIFKHGSFATAGRKDVNFYTSQIPAIQDRGTALSALLAARDVGASVTTQAGGTEARIVAGWSDANDKDGDGRRDHVAEGGILTAVGPGTASDDSRAWAAGQHAGRVLVDSAGRTFPITGNDATTLQLSGGGRPTFSAGNAARSFYAIDDPTAADHRATAMEKARTWFLLPLDLFSQLNFEFRKRADGRHIPVVDGRSYRVLLATSWLEPGETQQNRYALHTLTRTGFDALKDPKLRRIRANFDGKLQLVGYRLEESVVSRGDKLQLTTYWEVLDPVRSSFKFFLHVDRQGTSNRIHGDHWPLNLTEGGEDDKDCTGCYRTDHWMKGDIIMDVFEKEIPTGTPSGPQDIWMGLYRPGGGDRLTVKDWDKKTVRHDGANRARVGVFQVR